MSTKIIAIFIVMLALIAACCTHSTESFNVPLENDNPSVGEMVAPIGCPRAIVSSGMGLAWKNLNHRISFWDVHPQTSGCPDSLVQQVQLVAGYIGGNWSTGQTASDVPIVKYNYFAVDARQYAGFYPMTVEVEINPPDYTSNKAISLDLEEAGIAGFDSYEVFLSGLTLDTDVPQTDPMYPDNYTPDMGYTARGIGAGVEDVDEDGNSLEFTAWARFELGQADRPGMNAAIPHATTKAEVHVLVMGYRQGNVAFKEHGYALNYGAPLPLMQPDYPHANSQIRKAYLRGKSGYDNNFLALTSFNFRLFGSVQKGDYIREMSVRLNMLSYDAKTGMAVVDVDGFASNASLLTYEQMENDFDARVALVQLPGGSSLEGAVETQFDTGKTQMLLP